MGAGLSCNTHRYLLPLISYSSSVSDEICRRAFNFVLLFVTRDSDFIRSVAEHAVIMCARCSSLLCSAQTESQKKEGQLVNVVGSSVNVRRCTWSNWLRLHKLISAGLLCFYVCRALCTSSMGNNNNSSKHYTPTMFHKYLISQCEITFCVLRCIKCLFCISSYVHTWFYYESIQIHYSVDAFTSGINQQQLNI